jgi:hypothetical protein
MKPILFGVLLYTSAFCLASAQPAVPQQNQNIVTTSPSDTKQASHPRAGMDPSVETLRPPSIEKQKAEAVPQEEDVNGRWTMIFTGATACVAFLQMLLFVWKLRLMRHSVNDSTKAANAAERSARAAIAMELPVIRMIPPEDLVATDVLIGGEGSYGGIVNDGPPTRFSAIGRFEVQNHGRTSAFPAIFSIGWAVTAKLPETPNYKKQSVLITRP